MTPTVTYQQAKELLPKVRPTLAARLNDDDIFSIGIVRDGADWAFRAELRSRARGKVDQSVLRIDGIPLFVEYVGEGMAMAADETAKHS